MRYKTALVGCGAISAKHLEACKKNRDRADLVALCDIDRTRAKSLASSYSDAGDAPVPADFDNLDEMIETTRPDVVAIATSSSSHYEITRAALASGAHVILEKPIALSTGEAREIVRFAEERKRKLAVCFITRFAPHVRKLRRTIQEGAFGRLMHASIQLRWNRSDEYFSDAPWRGTWEHDGGMLMNQGTHGIDLLLWLFGGKVQSVYGVGRRFQRPIEAEDFATAVLQYENGSVALIEATINTYPKNLTQSLSIFGETGTAVLDGTHLGEISTLQIPECYESPSIAKDELQGHPALYEDFFNALDEDHEPLVNGREGLKSLEVILGVYESMKQRMPVDLPVDFATRDMEGIWNS